MKLSVCVDSLFKGDEEYFNHNALRLARSGFHTIEFWGWWNKDIDNFEILQNTQYISVAALCTRFISLVDSSKRAEYLQGLRETIEVAERLGAKVIISQVGAELPCPREQQRQSLVEGLKEAAKLLENTGIVLAIEPLNIRVDHQGYFLSSSDECVEILKEVGSESVKMLFDIYHQQITEGDVCRRIEQYIDYIAHFHIAGNPGRHELYNSELNAEKVFETIEKTGYKGCVGLEYYPLDDIDKGLEYARKIAPGGRD